MFWFSKKRSGVDNSKVRELDRIMKSSFYNVKQDMSELSSWVKEVHTVHKNNIIKLQDHDQRLVRIEQKLLRVLDQLSKKQNNVNINPAKELQEIKEEIADKSYTSPDSSILSELTTTHKQLFQMVYQLQKQLGGNAVSFKSLASMAYADKDYGKIRSTISQYLNSLYQMGLIDKKRYGKEAYITITDVGLKLIEGKIEEEGIKKHGDVFL